MKVFTKGNQKFKDRNSDRGELRELRGQYSNVSDVLADNFSN